MKLHAFATKHKANANSEHLIYSNNYVLTPLKSISNVWYQTKLHNILLNNTLKPGSHERRKHKQENKALMLL